MKRKGRHSAANGAMRIAPGSENAEIVTETCAAAKRPVVTRIRRKFYGKAEWLVSIEGVSSDIPIRDRKLRRYRRFCAAIKHRFGVVFDPMPQAAWLAMVEKTIRVGSS
jgi:hypothetical protein